MSLASQQTPRVVVIQSGARHDYAIPNAFSECGWLEVFHTDICTYSGLSWAVSVPGLPDSVRRFLKRKPSAATLRRTFRDPIATWRMLRLSGRFASDYRTFAKQRQQILEERTNRLLKRGFGNATHVFSAFGEGGRYLMEAKAAGLPVLTDIYVAFSTLDIERAEWEAFPDWGPEPIRLEDTTIDGRDHALETIANTSIFVCPSAFVADDLVTNWGVQRDDIRIVPYGVASGWEEVVSRPRKGRILFAGSAVRRKGIHILAKTARLLAQQGRDDIEFVVVGGVPEAVRSHPEASGLTFLGRVPRDAVRTHFAEADIFVLPTLAEGSATVVYEAMAAGLPVITTHEAGVPITAGVDGLIVPARDIEAIAAAIVGLVDDRDRRDTIAAIARQSASQFTPKKQAARIRGLIDGTNSPSCRSFQSFE